jgi:hypothetical protein
LLQPFLQFSNRLLSNVLLSPSFLCGVDFGRQKVPANIRVERPLLEDRVNLLLGLNTEDCPFPRFTSDPRWLNPDLDSEFPFAVPITGYFFADFAFLDLLPQE